MYGVKVAACLLTPGYWLASGVRFLKAHWTLWCWASWRTFSGHSTHMLYEKDSSDCLLWLVAIAGSDSLGCGDKRSSVHFAD